MTMHEEWTDRLSDYLDGELEDSEATAVQAHLRECAACAAAARPPEADLWPGIAGRIEAGSRPLDTGAAPRGQIAGFRPNAARRITFTLPQLAAAALVVAAVSGSLVWELRPRVATGTSVRQTQGVPSPSADAAPGNDGTGAAALAPNDADAHVSTVGLADAQYDAAVADLEKALNTGRGRLDSSTIAVVEHNLQIIDQAINQAREALIGDPANTYLSSHLVEARRRKLDLLRRATALTTDMD
jgi:hypothetical protein